MGNRVGARRGPDRPTLRADGASDEGGRVRRGLLSGTERKNGWQLVEYLGDVTPDGVQYLLARVNWNAEAVRNELIDYVAEELGTPEGVLIVDERGS